MKDFHVYGVQKQVFTSAALVEVVEVLVVLRNILRAHFHLLFFFLGILRAGFVECVDILVGL